MSSRVTIKSASVATSRHTVTPLPLNDNAKCDVPWLRRPLAPSVRPLLPLLPLQPSQSPLWSPYQHPLPVTLPLALAADGRNIAKQHTLSAALEQARCHAVKPADKRHATLMQRHRDTEKLTHRHTQTHTCSNRDTSVLLAASAAVNSASFAAAALPASVEAAVNSVARFDAAAAA